MTRQINLAEAKAKFSELVDAASRGEEIVLARHGKAMARLAPLAAAPKGPRQFGQYEHLARDIDWDKWWEDWKAADREIENEIDRSELFPGGFAEDSPPTLVPDAASRGKPKSRGRRKRRAK